MAKKRYNTTYTIDESKIEIAKEVIEKFLADEGFEIEDKNDETIYLKKVTEREFTLGDRPQAFKFSIDKNNIEISAWIYDHDYSFSIISLEIGVGYTNEMGLDGCYAMMFKRKYKKKLIKLGEKINSI